MYYLTMSSCEESVGIGTLMFWRADTDLLSVERMKDGKFKVVDKSNITWFGFDIRITYPSGRHIEELDVQEVNDLNDLLKRK